MGKWLDGYQRKKYICKLIYIHILGYEVDFGHEEALILISSSVYSEKCIGYIAVSLLISERQTEVWKRIGSFIQADLNSSVEVNVSLGLVAVGTLAPEPIVQALTQPVLKMALTSTASHSLFTRKKAMLTLLRIYRKYSDSFGDIKYLAPHLANAFETRLVSLGYMSALVSLLMGLGSTGADRFLDCQNKVIKCLQKLILQKDCS
jgi:AP-2 complex subunit alpha